MSKLVAESLPRTIVKMAVPMVAGTFAMNAYNLTNAYFVSRLGTEALAAISFAYPVVMLVMFVSRGLGSGAMTLVAHAIGAKDHARAATLTTHALLFGVVYAAAISLIGLLTMRPVFARLGASGAVLETTASYMRIWYLFAAVMVLQMMTADIIISTGSTRTISALMVLSTGLNVLFDLGLIFGRFGLPRLGIVGAAWATILAQSVTLLASCWILARRLHLLDAAGLQFRAILRSWGRILRFGVPGALGMMMNPLSAAVVTRLVASHGNAAVAALGVAARIEMFAFMIPMTVGMSLIPLVAQNYGARRLDRVRAARRGTMTFAVLYGVFIGLMFLLFAPAMARIFSAEQAVIDVLCTYIYITCMGYGMLEVHRYAGFVLTGTHEPVQATLLTAVRVLVLLIPLAIAGNALFGLKGIFAGRLTAELLAGSVGIWWSGRVLAAKAREMAPPAAGGAG